MISLFSCFYSNALQVNNPEGQQESTKSLFSLTMSTAIWHTQISRSCECSVTGRYVYALLQEAHPMWFTVSSSSTPSTSDF